MRSLVLKPALMLATLFGFAIVNAKVSDIIYHWIQAEGNSVLEILGQKLGSAELDGKL